MKGTHIKMSNSCPDFFYSYLSSPPLKKMKGLEYDSFEDYLNRRLQWEDVLMLKDMLVEPSVDSKLVESILETAGWIWEQDLEEHTYDPSRDTHLGQPKKDSEGKITPESLMEWYNNAQEKGTIPKHLDEETAWIIYSNWMPDLEKYKRGQDPAFEYLWENVDRFIYGDNNSDIYVSNYDHSNEI